MPILAAECDIYPTDLLNQVFTDDNPNTCWWAAYTRSRQEKQLTRSLLSLEIPFYCPIVPHRYRSPSGRTRVSFLPLFSNYVFIRGDGTDRYRALKTNLITSTLEVKNGLELTQDLRQIQQIIRRGAPVAIENELPVGTKVRIKSGPLTNIEGTIVKRQDSVFLFVAVNFLQQGALIKLESWEVTPLE